MKDVLRLGNGCYDLPSMLFTKIILYMATFLSVISVHTSQQVKTENSVAPVRLLGSDDLLFASIDVNSSQICKLDFRPPLYQAYMP